MDKANAGGIDLNDPPRKVRNRDWEEKGGREKEEGLRQGGRKGVGVCAQDQV